MSTDMLNTGKRDDAPSASASPTVSGKWQTRSARAMTLKPTIYCPPSQVDDCLNGEPQR